MKKCTYIIAEIGVNHNGSLALAKKLINMCKKCGADAVKFQTYKTDLIKMLSRLVIRKKILQMKLNIRC